ncbi:MAG: sialate O-acetylesterase [Flavobacteriaceae bacterium]
MKKQSILIALLFTLVLNAQTKLPAFFSDNMILQQNENVTIWGKDTPGKVVKICPEWGKSVKVKTDKNGDWKTAIKTLKADKIAYKVTIKGSDKITINNVLFGEVWFCAGQSNMEMPIKGYPNSPILGSNEALLYGTNKFIRSYHVNRNAIETPQFDTKGGQWLEANSVSIRDFSATAYFFAKELNKVLDVPVAIINSSWGGAAAEAFVDNETLISQFPKVFTRKKGKYEHGIMHKPSLIYNGMVAPFEGYNIQGVIWNQGETNRDRFTEYKELLPAMFNHWRKKWKDDFSFYMVQVAPFYYGDGRFVTFIGESIVEITKHHKNTGFASTIDIGKCSDIHAPNKETIGKRLALVAFAKNYGFDGIMYSGPIYREMKITEDHKIEVYFDEQERGLITDGDKKEPLNNFEIAGSDKIFHKADAHIVPRDGKSYVVVSSTKVPEPVAVRYAFGNCIKGEIYNTAGLPMISFRTDDWDDVDYQNPPKDKK